MKEILTAVIGCMIGVSLTPQLLERASISADSSAFFYAADFIQFSGLIETVDTENKTIDVRIQSAIQEDSYYLIRFSYIADSIFLNRIFSKNERGALTSVRITSSTLLGADTHKKITILRNNEFPEKAQIKVAMIE